MPKLGFTKTKEGLVPSSQDSLDWFDSVENGADVDVTVTIPRNKKFHNKFFVMLRVAYDNREWPEVKTQYGMARCSFELFRKYVTVKAGYYTPELTPRGEVRVTAKSISWANMKQEEFDQLYSDALDVILAEFLSNWTRKDMNEAVAQMLSFA
jgi:hypothetical protein